MQMTRAASSRPSAPATYAAATSPMLCPTTASGATPHERHPAAAVAATPGDDARPVGPLQEVVDTLDQLLGRARDQRDAIVQVVAAPAGGRAHVVQERAVVGPMSGQEHPVGAHQCREC